MKISQMLSFAAVAVGIGLAGSATFAIVTDPAVQQTHSPTAGFVLLAGILLAVTGLFRLPQK